jgi:type III secretion protein T
MTTGVVQQNLFDAVPWLDQFLLVSVSSARFAFVFLFVPLFSQQVMPATVRNSIIITFGLVAYVLHADFIPRDLSAAAWLVMLLKEAAAGTIIGFFFASVLWAMSAAGELIDTKVGATVGQLVDPLSGMQTSLTAILLSRFSQIVFVTAGGFTLLVGTVMESYTVWPIGPSPVILNPSSVTLFEGEFSRLIMLAFIFAAPVLTVLYVIDIGMGFLNRFAQQFNVFSLSMPIKAAGSVFMLILMLPLLAGAVVDDMMKRPSISQSVLERTAKPTVPPPPKNVLPAKPPASMGQ